MIPTGFRRVARRESVAELKKLRPRLRRAARLADEAADTQLYTRILEVWANLDDILNDEERGN